ncbi:hypothetical protein EDB81DRAFT_884839 [Dactylonectria macrodidyma]|uniref:Uncharacterized protein n=1 Tax=Dactylonectria macrodidyma TaxID=307937 RepID=A0A9P9EQL0_9HYPO|nr:hypothetical protein EDB81DRAFT_884839 [Dactylonectria macrodidyma]
MSGLELIALGVALAQLVEYTKTFATDLCKISQDASGAVQEMEPFSTRSLTFTQTVECAMVSLRQHNRAHQKSPVLIYITPSHVFVGIEAEANSLFNFLKPALQWIKANKKLSTRLWATIKWLL